MIKRILRRLIAVYVSIVLVITGNFCFAKSAKASDIRVEVQVEERAGKSGTEIIERGFLLPDKFSSDISNITVIDESNVSYPFQCRAMEYYDSGFIKRLSGIIEVNLSAYESKKLYLTTGEQGNACNVVQQGGNIIIENGSISVTINNGGIDSITQNGITVIENANVFARKTTGGQKIQLNNCAVQIVQSGEVGTTVKLSGAFDDALAAEWVITVYKNQNIVKNELRYITKADTTIADFGIETYMGALSRPSYETDAETYESGFVRSSYLSVTGNDTVGFVSADIDKYKGALGKYSNGFKLDSGILFEPLIAENQYYFYDGMSRTSSMYMVMDSSIDLDGLSKKLK